MIDFLVAGDKTIFFYLLILLLGVGVLQALSVGGLFFLKRSGDRRANWFFGTLLILFGLTLTHNIIHFAGWNEQYPGLKFLPVYFTLSFPVLLFYHVKLSLYPEYRLRLTDVKHFFLPVGQAVFFLILFFSPTVYKSEVDRSFFNPFYGALEQGLYLIGFYAYLYFAHRYIRQKRLALKGKNRPREIKAVFYLRTLIRVLLVLFIVHTVFVVGDFVYFKLFEINFRAVKPYVAFGMLSFAALGYWMGTYGFQVLFWGRKVFNTSRKA
jgi:hypothetical protein